MLYKILEHGFVTKTKDDTLITYRYLSKSEPVAVFINIDKSKNKTIVKKRIHFIGENE